MFHVIQDAYKLYLKKLPVWFLFVLPLVVYSTADDYLRVYFADSQFYIYLSVVLSPVVYAAVQLAIYKYVMKTDLGKVWGTVKKLVLFTVIQFAMAFVMMLPMFVFPELQTIISLVICGFRLAWLPTYFSVFGFLQKSTLFCL